MELLEFFNSNNLSLILLATCLWILIQALPTAHKIRKSKSIAKSKRKLNIAKNNEILSSVPPPQKPVFNPKQYIGSYKAHHYTDALTLKKEAQGFDKLLIDKILLDKDRFIQSHVDKLSVEDFFLIAVALNQKQRLEFVERLPTMRAVKERILLAAKLKKL